MKLLLDTHALLWWLGGDKQLSRNARQAIGDEGNAAHVSAASAWEIATKVRIGKLPEAEEIVAVLPEFIVQQQFTPLDVTVAHALRAGTLSGPHRDPFDRMLIAQALAENMTVVSNDKIFDRYAVQRLW